MIQGILKKVFKAREKLGSRNEDNPEAEKPFLDHLDDLRIMIIRIVTTLIVSLFLCFLFNSVLIDVIRAPLGFVDVPVLEDGEPVMKDGEEVTQALSDAMTEVSINPVGVFMLAIKVSFLAALTISFPFLVYFLLQFILPGLRDKERKILWPAMAIGFGLFIGGVLFAYFVVVPRAMQFFYMFGVERGIEVQWTIELYSKFAVRFILIFGICFELPVLVMALVKLDILNYTFMAKRRGAAVVILFFVAAVITPTHDALTLALLGAPMYILYEICIWLSYFMEKKDRKLNPELYETKERIEAELAAEADKPMQWGGFGGGGDDDDPDQNHDDDFHHDDYHHDDEWHDPHSDDPHHDEHGHDDHDDHLHDPDHETVDDADHGGGTRLDAGSHDDTVEKDHAKDHEDPHHDDPYHDEFKHGHGDDQDEIDEYHRHLAEFEAEEAKREAEEKVAEAKLQAESEREHSEAKDDTETRDDAEDHEATLEEFSARDESAAESVEPEAAGLPAGAALGDTTGLGDQPAKSVPNLDTRIRDLEDLVNRMADRIDALETRSDDS